MSQTGQDSTGGSSTGRTCRAEVVRQFDGPAGGVRDQLLARQADHEVFASAFTEAGRLTHGPTLTRFTVRHLLRDTAPCSVAADSEAATTAEVRTMEFLEQTGAPCRDLTVSVTSLEDLRLRR